MGALHKSECSFSDSFFGENMKSMAKVMERMLCWTDKRTSDALVEAACETSNLADSNEYKIRLVVADKIEKLLSSSESACCTMVQPDQELCTQSTAQTG